MNRIHTIDVTRGLVMVVMALDHVRDLLHTPALTQDPTDLSTTTASLFLTRWITHLCAPTFVFLSGTSAYLSLSRRNTADRRFWLLKRGLVLLILELTLINFAFWTDLQFRTLMLQVIFVIGTGLMLLSGMAKLPVRWLAGIGLSIVVLHDLLLLVPPFSNPAVQLLWSLLFRTQLFPVSPQFMLLVAYPIVPWFGIMLLGYASGSVFTQPAGQRKRQLLKLGVLSLGLFLVLRFVNVYGDGAPWSVQKDTLFTVLSFINVSKYPPSLLYALLMLGIMFMILWTADGVMNPFCRWLITYGKVPLFYYLIHWYLVKGAMIGMMLSQGYKLSDLIVGPLSFGRPPGSGVNLLVVYLIWIGLVAILYPLCRWYGRYKADHQNLLTRYV
ncbi:DUF1624 domain-containing protein [Spirosoma sp. KUDC1026]|uniref:DUF1624 domain-containing protein n=1 Tax=Spirosoma sp. KUDC1026 TaxID=2745947 RepID=UPI00159BD4E2|nr:heparan-alpha-glucosaminide N-acetyltransferase domain-containing protein [Spirosoma sp. KUDC1026]QKZ11138.1 DUF1624 domain-containing protein [Spirosoma sp. KUDC1026]